MAKRIISEPEQARIMAKAAKSGDPHKIALAMAQLNGQSREAYLNAIDGQQPCAPCEKPLDNLR